MNEQAMHLSRYVIASDLLHVPRRNFRGHLLFSARSGALRTVPALTWDRLCQGRMEELSNETVRELRDAGMLVEGDEDEICAVLDENRRAIDQQDVLYQVVQPSAWCQLDCGYCGQEHIRTSLAANEQASFLQRIAQRLATHRYRHLRIGWFGAEPLAGISVIRSMTPALRALAESHGCSYGARIVTNGLSLTEAMATELSTQLYVHEAEVTLDGLAPFHDRTRPTKKGRGSFERIFANVKSVARSTPLEIVIRCNVGQQNAEGVAPLILAIADAGLARLVRFYTSPVYAWGNDAHRTALTPQRYAEAELEWLALQHRLGFKVGLLPQRRPIVCMAVQREAEVLDAQGHSYNCTEVPYVPAYAPADGEPDLYAIRIVPRGKSGPGDSSAATFQPIARKHSSGRAAAGVAAARLSNFNDQIRSGTQAPCHSCAMLPVCGGQCPKAWHEGHEPCPSAKINIAQRLALHLAITELEEIAP